jgi:hypothetical protein
VQPGARAPQIRAAARPPHLWSPLRCCTAALLVPFVCSAPFSKKQNHFSTSQIILDAGISLHVFEFPRIYEILISSF